MSPASLPNVLGFPAFSLLGGYPTVCGGRDEANERLARQPGMIASFSRALMEGMSAQQSDDDFNAGLVASIESIYQASIT